MTKKRLIQNLIDKGSCRCRHGDPSQIDVAKNDGRPPTRKRRKANAEPEPELYCVWQGKYADLPNHLANDCGFALENCPVCDAKVARKD